jgi:hypothetical protein
MIDCLIQRASQNLWGEADEPATFRGASVRDACIAIRLGCFDEAEALLDQIAGQHGRDAVWLNLMGVVCQARAYWRGAKRFYGKAMRAERSFVPAEQNMRRWFELFTFGRTNLAVALGEETAEKTN